MIVFLLLRASDQVFDKSYEGFIMGLGGAGNQGAPTIDFSLPTKSLVLPRERVITQGLLWVR